MNLDQSRANVLRYLDGALPDADLAELNDLLSANPDLRREFAHLLLQQVHLSDIGQARTQANRSRTAVATAKSPADKTRDRALVPFPSFYWRPRFLAAAAVLAILVSIFAISFFSNAPYIETLVGNDFTLQRDAMVIPVRAGLALKAGDILRTGPTNRLIISYRRENTRLLLAGHSRIAVHSSQSGKAFGLLDGRVEAAVAHQAKGRPMIWETPTTRSTVVGTEFTLTSSATTSRLDVLEGTVNFESLNDGKALRVNASQYAELAPGVPFELRELPHASSSVLREIWLNVTNIHIRDLTQSPRFPAHPDLREYPTAFAALTNWPASSGVRLRAFLRAPKTGDYRFWIKGADAAELRLSSNELPESADLIASLNLSALGGWEKFPWQKSPAIRLLAERKYYIEALFKKGSAGVDDAEVAWQPPAGTRESIPSQFLSPVHISSEGGTP